MQSDMCINTHNLQYRDTVQSKEIKKMGQQQMLCAKEVFGMPFWARIPYVRQP